MAHKFKIGDKIINYKSPLTPTLYTIIGVSKEGYVFQYFADGKTPANILPFKGERDWVLDLTPFEEVIRKIKREIYGI